MRRPTQLVFVVLLLVAATTPTAGQSATDEEGIRRLATRFETAWNTHDMNLLWVVVRDNGTWRVRAVQNTDKG